ncbi:hypothetical protein PybrP1_010176 [[Pythium] brassicae (nom. inval.)]|nr:hypothetical protein PybrP1_010176 [[Pythium] brassicae (nom. inval.)]
MSQSAPASLASGRSNALFALATTPVPPPKPAATASDLELRLLRALGGFVGASLSGSFATLKRSSRLTNAAAAAAEDFAATSRLAAVVGGLVAQLQRAAQPWVAVVDDAVSQRVLELVVGILLLAKVRGEVDTDGAAAQRQQLVLQDEAELVDVERGGSGAPVGRLSHRERIRALLGGELPRLEALLQDARRRELEALAAQQRLELEAAAAPAPIVMELKDFVPVDEVKRMKDAARALVLEKQREAAALREQLGALECERQRLEQALTDVHSYQESERGRRFQEMEEELARTKLDANQKAHNLRTLEIVVETLRRKRKSKGARSEAGRSATTSDGGEGSPSKGASTA